MIDIYPAPDHVAAFRVSGTLTGEDYDRVIADIEARLARHPRINVLVDLTGFDDVSAKAVWKDARYSVSLMRDLKRFPREAVISDKQWVRVLAQVANPLVPHVEVKVFGSAERDAALAWVSEMPPAR